MLAALCVSAAGEDVVCASPVLARRLPGTVLTFLQFQQSTVDSSTEMFCLVPHLGHLTALSPRLRIVHHLKHHVPPANKAAPIAVNVFQFVNICPSLNPRVLST